jgi:hypothetical protein
MREISLLPCSKPSCVAIGAASSPVRAEDLVFPTRSGGQRGKDNLRSRVLHPTLEARGQPPLPTRLTTHGLRHTFASVLIALGEDPDSVMVQLGHTDPAFSLRVCTHMMRPWSRGAGASAGDYFPAPARQRIPAQPVFRVGALSQSLRKLRRLMTAKANRFR